MAQNSIGTVTALPPHIGYEKFTIAADGALIEKRPIAAVVAETGFLNQARC